MGDLYQDLAKKSLVDLFEQEKPNECQMDYNSLYFETKFRQTSDKIDSEEIDFFCSKISKFIPNCDPSFSPKFISPKKIKKEKKSPSKINPREKFTFEKVF